MILRSHLIWFISRRYCWYLPVEVGAGSCAVAGCTDAAASNYDSAANTDDGSCLLL